MSIMGTRFSRRSHLGLVALALTAAAACDRLTPEEACAGAARASAGLDVNHCLADLAAEKDGDSEIYEADLKCLSAVAKTELHLEACLARPGSFTRLRDDRTRRDADLSARVGEVDVQLGKLRDTLGRLQDGDQKAAFEKLLHVADEQRGALKQGLSPGRDDGGRK